MLLMGPRAWRLGLKKAIFLPPELGAIAKLISEGKHDIALRELWRLAHIGSNQAAAALAYISLVGGGVTNIDHKSAIDLCRAAARRNNPYAQYVIAWSEYEKGHMKEFIKWLIRAAKLKFPPALGDLGRVFSTGPEKSIKHLNLAKRLFALSIIRGHCISMTYFLGACRHGSFGPVLYPLGIIKPLMTVLLIPILWLRPFTVSMFTYPIGGKVRVFETNFPIRD